MGVENSNLAWKESYLETYNMFRNQYGHTIMEFKDGSATLMSIPEGIFKCKSLDHALLHSEYLLAIKYQLA